MADHTADARMTEGGEPFFAPECVASPTRVPGGVATVPRLVLRAAVCVLCLVALDWLIAPSLEPPSAYLHSYRLPSTSPTAALADYANAIDLAARVTDRKPIAVFLGASPTYGHRIKDAANTFPYAYASAAASAGTPVTAFNVAANGMFVGDFVVLAKRLGGDADIVFVQLTYHTFAPSARSGQRVRYRELPGVLGVSLTKKEATLLGLQANAGDGAHDSAVPLGGALSRWWTLWRERDLIDRRLFGGNPRDALARFVGRMTGGPAPISAATTTTVLPADTSSDAFASFDDLDPGTRMVAIARYAEDSSFTIDPADSEVVLLDALAADLAAAHKKAVFYLGPLNEDVIDSYRLIDPARYRANVDLLRQTVGRHGFSLLDHNLEKDRLPAGAFADISHTTDEGGAQFGAMLLRDTLSYLRSATP